jgi:hypothetical protein
VLLHDLVDPSVSSDVRRRAPVGARGGRFGRSGC